MDLIRLDDVKKEYGRGRVRVPVLRGVSLGIARGEMVALMGASGSGKTTLINLVGALDRPTEGRYRLDGEEVVRLSEDDRALLRSEKLGFVFQSFHLLPRLTALENVMMPLAYAAKNLSGRECRARARALLERVGLGGRLDHEPSRLSGGEQQRVAIARALVNHCELLIADEPTGNLDSQTGEEILALFRQLNEEDGITILLVTHDPTVAAHADRTIRIRDGLVYGAEASPVPAPPTPAPGTPRRRRAVRRRQGPRRLARSGQTALRSLQRNAMRSLLTTLGIVIGVSALIAIAEIGQGSARAIRGMLTETGVDNILVQSASASRNGVNLGSGSLRTITPDDADSILRDCPSVASLAPIVYARQQVVRGNRNCNPMYFYGTTPSFLRVRDWDGLAQGGSFTEREVRDVALVCLLGKTPARELFGEESPVGQEVYANGVPLKVLGVLSEKGANIIGEDQDDIVLAPWTTVRFRISGAATRTPAPEPGTRSDLSALADPLARRFPPPAMPLYPSSSFLQKMDLPQLQRPSHLDSILIRARTSEEIPTAMEEIAGLLRDRHRIAPNTEDDFAVRDFTEVIRAVQATIQLVAGILLCVALISLIVGGVGIMNIMLVSVTERYREIGLRRAVGATPDDILWQFLVEAIVLCLFGGAVGILAGRGASWLVRILARWPTEASPLALFVSVGVSATVGVVFGYYPAWKASRLDPIEALRSD